MLLRTLQRIILGVKDQTTISAKDQPESEGPHSQLCCGPAQKSRTTQPALLRTSPEVKDHTASSAADQPGSQGPRSHLWWGPAWKSRTTQPALLQTSLEVKDHTASSVVDQPGSQGPHSQLCCGPAWKSRTSQPALLQTSLEVKDHTVISDEDQPGRQGLQYINIKSTLIKQVHTQVRICYHLPTELFGKRCLYGNCLMSPPIHLVICPSHFHFDVHFITACWSIYFNPNYYNSLWAPV